ncbi:hypothetical protein O181_078729 [Austropuccinia psidii MF-1]|uniref:Uncharacterized protein n=1 Tax=Austropuccinia psidii MF-1 TaxID=1389203 RepID=A0A9Q3FHH3_9BASI|nr:hypothetical protein [Austropuccinia psidii MF-1]
MLQLPLPHPHLILSATYHASAPAAPSRYDSDTTTPCLPSPILMLPHPQDMDLTLAPHLSTHPSLQYASNTSTPCPPSPILTLPQTCHLQCLHSRRTLKICLRHQHLISTLTHPYASEPPPLTMLTLPHHPQDIPPTPAPHLRAHPSLRFRTPAAYHPYTPILDQ